MSYPTMEKAQFRKYIENIKTRGLRKDPFPLRLDGHEEIFNPYHAYRVVPLKITTAFLQENPAVLDDLERALKDPEANIAPNIVESSTWFYNQRLALVIAKFALISKM